MIYTITIIDHNHNYSRNTIESNTDMSGISDGDTDSSVDIRYRKSTITDVRSVGGSGRNYNYNYKDSYGWIGFNSR